MLCLMVELFELARRQSVAQLHEIKRSPMLVDYQFFSETDVGITLEKNNNWRSNKSSHDKSLLGTVKIRFVYEISKAS